MSQAEAARVFGVHPNAVNRWVKRYRAGGFKALSEQRRGRRAGEQAALSPGQQQEVIALVSDATPDQLGMSGFLWTRDAVAELVAQRYGVRLARTTVGRYLRSWNFSPQKPKRRALEQKRTGKRFRVNMISAISNEGLLRFRLFSGSFTGPVFIDFLRRLLRDLAGRKVHLIVDGHPVHRAKLVSAWVERRPARLELHFLPGYSPELNPVELLNNDVKANAAGRRRARTVVELTGELRVYARRRQRQPEVVVGFFQHPDTCYAAAY